MTAAADRSEAVPTGPRAAARWRRRLLPLRGAAPRAAHRRRALSARSWSRAGAAAPAAAEPPGWSTAGWVVAGVLVATAVLPPTLLPTRRGRRSHLARRSPRRALCRSALDAARRRGRRPTTSSSVLVLVWACATHPPSAGCDRSRSRSAAGLARARRLATDGWPVTDAVESGAPIRHLVRASAGFDAGLDGRRARAAQDRPPRERAPPTPWRAWTRSPAWATAVPSTRSPPPRSPAPRAAAGRSACLVADLDQFKAINDEHGHLAGDDCLRQVAAAVTRPGRRPDVCFRWGGDEFAILLRRQPHLEGRARSARASARP